MMRKLRDASSPARLIALAFALALCFLAWRSPSLSREETALYTRIQAAQNLLWTAMEQRGQTDPVNDPDHCGFIGLDWSETSTTLGNLKAKRNACDPLWGAIALRWFDQLGLAEGDRIVVLSSSSFPGLLYSVLAAAESRGLHVALVVSLGSSAWGANRPEAPWPVMARILSSHGFLNTRPAFYTLGGNDEIGKDMPEDGLRLLTAAALADGVELYRPRSLAEVIDRKMALIDPPGGDRAKLVINIGGAHSSLGTDDRVIGLSSGLLPGGPEPQAGNGLIAKVLELGLPVAHFLNLRALAERMGISYEHRRPFTARGSAWPPAIGLVLFLLVLATHQRWSWDTATTVSSSPAPIPAKK